MLASQARLFTQALVDRYVIDHDTAETALDEASRSGEEVEAVIKRFAKVSDKDLSAAWCSAMGLGFLDLEVDIIHPEAAGLVPHELMEAHSIIGVSTEGNRLHIAIPTPIEPASMHEIVAAVASATGHEVIPVGGERHDLLRAVRSMFGSTITVIDDEDEQEEPGISDKSSLLHHLFDKVIELGGSDLHLAANHPPFIRIMGELIRMEGEDNLSATQVREMVFSLLSPKQQKRFEEQHELDAAFALSGRVRFRLNVFVQRNMVGAAFRIIPAEVVPLPQLGLPAVVASFAAFPRGLVLVTGPTGSGKSTTLASVLDVVNQTRRTHIMTVEDPVEFMHVSKYSLVNQRQVGDDTGDFAMALRQAMRQDPDVIMVGEMRDLETIQTAISAAETGHLVFATLHTQDSAQTVDRIVDVFPAEQQSQVRVQLASTLQAILCQQLVPTLDGRGRIAACEVLLATPATRALIRDGKIHQIHNQIQSGKKQGMQSIDDALADLVRRGVISLDNAIKRARSADEIARQLSENP